MSNKNYKLVPLTTLVILVLKLTVYDFLFNHFIKLETLGLEDKVLGFLLIFVV